MIYSRLTQMTIFVIPNLADKSNIRSKSCPWIACIQKIIHPEPTVQLPNMIQHLKVQFKILTQ